MTGAGAARSRELPHAAALSAVVLAMLCSASCGRTMVNPPKPIEPTPAHVPPTPQPESKVDGKSFHATAYSVEGATKSGAQAREGIVAGDPKVLPLGSKIRVAGAGSYDGVYLVKDTGRKINGREIDIYLDDDAEAKRFGNKTVTVEVLEYGNGKREAAK